MREKEERTDLCRIRMALQWPPHPDKSTLKRVLISLMDATNPCIMLSLLQRYTAPFNPIPHCSHLRLLGTGLYRKLLGHVLF